LDVPLHPFENLKVVGKTLQQLVDPLREFVAVSKRNGREARLDLFRQAGAVI
jgi:hypothetical protein